MLFQTPPVENVPIPLWFRAYDLRWSDPDLSCGSYRRNLPHWRQEGCSYFLTFRLRDSLPANVVRALRDECEEWRRLLASERRAGRLTAALLKDWDALQRRHFLKAEAIMDAGHGECLLRDGASQDCVAGALRYFEDARCRMAAFVVMPNHVHALCQPFAGWPLEDLAGSWKQFAALKINARLRRDGQLWQRESFDRIVRDGAHFARVVRYIARNPEKARLKAEEAEVWLSEEIRAANA